MRQFNRFLFLWFALLALGCTSTVEQVTHPSEELDAEGRRLFVEAGTRMGWEEYSQAQRILKTLVRSHPQHFRTRRALQEIQLMEEGYPEALSAAEEKVRSNRNAEALTLLARLKKDWTEAAILLREALGLDGTYVWAHYGLAYLILKNQKAEEYETARAHLEEALNQSTGFNEARLLLVECLRRLGDEDGEEQQLRQYLSFDPGNQDLRYNLADLLRKKSGDLKAALEALEIVLASEPDRIDALLLKGIVLTQAGEYQAAETQFRNLYNRHPDAVLNLGFLYRDCLESPEEALRCFRDYLEYTGLEGEDKSFIDQKIRVPLYIETLEKQGL